MGRPLFFLLAGFIVTQALVYAGDRSLSRPSWTIFGLLDLAIQSAGESDG